MKVLSIVLSVIAALLIALIAVFFIGAALDADVSVATLPATQDALGFAAAVESVQLESAPAIYETLESVAAADYAVTDITVTFHNKGFFAAEWLTFEFIPATGDVALCTQSADRLDLPARGATDVLAAFKRGRFRRGARAQCGILRAGHAAHDDRAAGAFIARAAGRQNGQDARAPAGNTKNRS